MSEKNNNDVNTVKTPGINKKSSSEPKAFSAPDGFWKNCPKCSEINSIKNLEKSFFVCPSCSHHFRVSSKQRIEMLCDEGSFTELDQDLTPSNPLSFVDSKPYTERIKSSQKKTGMNDAFVGGEGKLGDHEIQVGSFEFSFMGGSMGSVVGEKVCRLFERGYKKNQPVIIFQSSGGARMQEGIVSLMQMAKTVAALNKFKEKRKPYISILTDPTTGGVAASFAMLGDINIAEPKALIGFAGPRVISQTINEKLPENFQSSEFLLEHGIIDNIVERSQIKIYVEKILNLLS